MNEFLDTREIPVDTEDVRANRVFGILSYVGILWLVGLFAANKSPYTRWHVNQGMLLSIASVGGNLVNTILIVIASKLHMGWLFTGVGSIFNLAITALMVFGIVFAAQGHAKELPLIGRFHIYDTENK